MTPKFNFGDLSKTYSHLENSAIVILPVPYDGTSTWGKGADRGPQAIIEASAHMELYDVETDSEIYKIGIFTDNPINENSSPEKMIEAVRKRVDSHLRQNKFVVVAGGEHTVSIGSIKAHKDHYGEISVLQLDAHADLRHEYNGSLYNHACVMARVKEMCPIIQVGIRSMDLSEVKFLNRHYVFFAKDIYNNQSWIDDIISKIEEKVYITIDLDVFDPSIMPSTGTPEPGGLLWYDVLSLLKKVIRTKRVIGFDVVELCPQNSCKAPDFLASKLIYTLLGYNFSYAKIAAPL